jgi:hypothetical protein
MGSTPAVNSPVLCSVVCAYSCSVLTCHIRAALAWSLVLKLHDTALGEWVMLVSVEPRLSGYSVHSPAIARPLAARPAVRSRSRGMHGVVASLSNAIAAYLRQLSLASCNA